MKERLFTLVSEYRGRVYFHQMRSPDARGAYHRWVEDEDYHSFVRAIGVRERLQLMEAVPQVCEGLRGVWRFSILLAGHVCIVTVIRS